MTSASTANSSSSDRPNDVSSSVSTPMVDRMARNAHTAVDRVADATQSAVGKVRSGVTDALSTANDAMHDLSASRGQWLDGCRQTVREHPLAVVGAGLAAGFLIARWLG